MAFSAIASARHAGATLATLLSIFPWKKGMILADPAPRPKQQGQLDFTGAPKRRRNTARRSRPLELRPHPGNAQKSLSFPEALDSQPARERITALRISPQEEMQL
jgi:hypothetical protein